MPLWSRPVIVPSMRCRLRRTSIEGPIQLSLKAGGVGNDRWNNIECPNSYNRESGTPSFEHSLTAPRSLPHPPHSNSAAPVGEIEDSSLPSKNPHFERLVTSLAVEDRCSGVARPHRLHTYLFWISARYLPLYLLGLSENMPGDEK